MTEKRSRAAQRQGACLRLALAPATALVLLLACSSGSDSERPAASVASDVEVLTPAHALQPSGAAYSEERAACRDRDPLRKVHWGELHVHSALSMDAWMWNVRGGPDAVYRFAKGEAIGLAPYDAEGRATRSAQLDRPLDFAALTDHASYQGEVMLCTRPRSPKYDTAGCRIYRGEMPGVGNRLRDFGRRMAGMAASLDRQNEIPARNIKLCGPDGRLCEDAMAAVWRQQVAAADRHYDRSPDCSFTTFNAYEYTATPGLSKVHHNVIFRNDAVPPAPVAWVDHPDVYDLWGRLKAECLDGSEGCDVLTVPHNSNLSNGRMFALGGEDLPLAERRARAALRAELEPLVEISQIKGDSECRNDMWGVVAAPDEFCNFEEWRRPGTEDCREGMGSGALAGFGCVSRSDYVRNVLVEGLRHDQRLGVNPFKLGIIAATDSHNATPGDVEEATYQGWRGSVDATASQRLRARNGSFNALFNILSSPGGLAGVWSEENSRDSLFDALERREVFGTSGPRMRARFFGGWELPASVCESSAADTGWVASAYEAGVPMGGDLPSRPRGAKAPTFVLEALRDPGIPERPGGLLQRAQVIKGWVGDDGKLHEEVIDVAGGANGAGVDLDTCAVHGPGDDRLCATWTDPDFDPSKSAVYYARVLENPSCRWSQRQCIALPADERPPACLESPVPRTIQERLWTSPIWYEPRG
jgi:hypothetical protein